MEDLGCVSFRIHNFGLCERTHSVESLILAVDTVAKGSVIRKEMSYDRALSTLVLFSCHSSKMLPMRQFFEAVLTDQDQCEMYMPEEAYSLLKRWGGISKEIYAGASDFEVDGQLFKFEVMKVMITILNSRKEDRCLVLEPNKIHPKKLKEMSNDRLVQFGGVFQWVVDLFWNLLASSRT